MSFHWNGLANDPGSLMMFAVAVMPIVFSLVVVFALYAFGSMIWSGMQAKRRRLMSGQSPEQFLQSADEQVRKAEEEWSLPPELNVPTPRPVRSRPLGIRLLRGLPHLIFLMALAVLIYTGGYLWTHVTWPQNLPSFVFHGFLGFLQAPQWQEWMLWPSVVFAGLAGLTSLPAHFQRRNERRLLKWGVPARAVVTAVSIGRRGNWWDCQYSDTAGNVIKTSSRSSMPRRGQLVLTILYDPDKPHHFITYPVARYLIAGPQNS
jgi:hypothetical protein